ncbi:hypothetical protein ACFQFC_18730 [Amorphoplanes digitatis]|uniref:Peptidase MA-like domain-containing protein n=1 Tax=Actinoplanes digitatis TaxID=1868 RepID=A0A7W7MTY2_9ACTN|nr:hypothetical protein [Actinoplanes digitatis]MBB4766252.1 hypothetical protein [Actinoplanes digitatis]
MSGHEIHGRQRHPWSLLALVLVLVCGSLALPGADHRLDPDSARAARPLDPAPPAAHAEEIIRRTLDRQSAALIGGDERGWLRDVDPPLAAEMHRLYRNLRGLRISGWVTDPAGLPAGRDGPVWETDVRIRVCFTGPACARDHVPRRSTDLLTASTAWRVSADRAVVTRFAFDGARGLPSRPTPWERGTLTFAAGRRVIVAAPRGVLRPEAWLAAAERAAVVADRFTLAEPRVGSYLVFLAGRTEWRTWFSAFTDRDVLGYALRPSDTSGFIVIDTTKVRPGAKGESVLRHEMAHIATRYGPSTRVGEWATEGIAEYVAWTGRPVSEYDRAGDARALAAKLRWTRQLDLGWSHSSALRSGYYGMGFFAMRCLSETFGEARMLDFFDRMAHGGRGPAQASGEAFGVSWAAAERTCAPRIRAWLRR